VRRLADRPFPNLIQVLDAIIRDGANLRAGSGPVGGIRDGYISWVRDAEASLAFHFDRHDVEEALLTPRYWEIRRLLSVDREVRALVNQEAEARVAEIEELRARYRLLRDRFAEERHRVLVPDTNVFLHYTSFREASWPQLADNDLARVVVPLLVVEQLDRLKYATNQKIAERARGVIRELSRLLDERGEKPAEIPKRGTIEVFIDEPGHVRMASEDAEIVEVARQLTGLLPKPARLVTGDLGMRLRAGALGVEVVALPDGW
jgi:rRNA-processing protein FCF1